MASTSHDYHDEYDNYGRKDTGLLTRFVPERLKHSALYRWFLRLTRLLQFLSAVISLGIFARRIHRVLELVDDISSSEGAVTGILAAAVLYTLLALLITALLRGGGPRWLRWLLVLFDILFVGAFIAVAVMTSPDGGNAGPNSCYDVGDRLRELVPGSDDDDSCDLPWGTFILAIISTILHAITAAFHEVRDRHRRHKMVDKRNSVDQYHTGTAHTTPY